MEKEKKYVMLTSVWRDFFLFFLWHGFFFSNKKEKWYVTLMSVFLKFFFAKNVFFARTCTKVQKHVAAMHRRITHSCIEHTQVVTNCTHTHVYTHEHTHTRTHARTHTHPHTHPYTHTNTHTHLWKPRTDTHCHNTDYLCSCSYSLSFIGLFCKRDL